MPRKYANGSESRLSREGLGGAEIDGKRVKVIYAHGERRRKRTVHFVDGTAKNMSIDTLVGHLIESREK